MKKIKMGKNLLVSLADENYIEQVKQLFSSAYFNAGWKGDYMLLAHEIPEKKLKWFRDKGILVKKCKSFYSKNKLEKLYNESSVTNKNNFTVCSLPIVLSKFYLVTPYFKKWKNIVYLDADMIVRASLDELTKIKRFGAVEDTKSKLKNQLNLRKNKILSNELKKNYNINSKAFNSGLLAFSTNVIKRDSFPKLKKLLEKYNKIRELNDQVPFNLLFHKKWIKLHYVYNLNPHYLIHFNNIKPEKIRGIVLHFMARNKPWLSKNPFYKEWKNNLKKAELIEFKKIPPAKKKWTKEDIEKYCKYLQKRHIFYYPKHLIWKTSIFIDRCFGFLGIFLKNNLPRLYFTFKKLEMNLKNEKSKSFYYNSSL